ncbi:MAG: PspC domain-containing protein [Ignavibacteriales bacterium]|nr:PspC domain-containing protein [Ignavibacteriales bacterium]
MSSAKTLRRSRSERKILGVCGGIAAYFDVDPSLVRIAFVFFSLWPFGLGVVLYLLMALIIPDENTSPQPGV